MRSSFLAATVLLAAACADVRVLYRSGCWVRQTETFPKTIHEEIGPCARPLPQWSSDRVARLVQECIAEADYRWQLEAVDAFSQGRPLPAQKDEQSVMDACMTHAATALLGENEALKVRIAELDAERSSLAAIAQQEREHLRAAEDRMADALGEAAKKPAPAAIATANSTGTASTQSDQSAPAGPTSITLPPPVEIIAPARAPMQPSAPVRCSAAAKPGACDLPASPAR